MHPLLADVLKVLELKRLDTDRFEGESRDPGHRRVFGGQVLGQALRAAYETVEGRPVHSFHAYFLRGGDPDHPIVYEVDRSRDGKSFTNRRVVAIQHGHQIFHMSASFQAWEEGTDRQAIMPSAPSPEQSPDLEQEFYKFKQRGPQGVEPHLPVPRPFDYRSASLPAPDASDANELHMKVWFKAFDPLPDDEVLHRTLLAYASDYYLLGTAMLDVRGEVDRRSMQIASIDHAMWFHRPVRVDEWLLYVMDSPSATSARGLALGKIFSQDGTLVASTVQEGLIRQRK